MKGYTLKLDVSAWDLTLDDTGQIAVSDGAYAVAQNVANAQRLFKQDAYFNQKSGIPHFETELGNRFNIAAPILRTRMKKAAVGVESVKDANVILEYENGRVCGARTKITLVNGKTATIET